MNAIIVGHGPSSLKRKAGRYIDAFDVVIRLKRTSASCLRYPEFFGKRTDILSGSWSLAHALLDAIDCPEYWIFFDSRHTDVSESDTEAMRHKFSSKRLRMLPDLCWKWDSEYRALIDKHSTFGLHPHGSSGFKTALYACKLLKPTKLVLYAFDAIKSGGHHTWSITRGKNYDRYPGHNFLVEGILLKRLATESGLRIEFS